VHVTVDQGFLKLHVSVAFRLWFRVSGFGFFALVVHPAVRKTSAYTTYIFRL
jgi:hypothetical protein